MLINLPFFLLTAALIATQAFGQGYHDSSLESFVHGLNFTGDMGMSTALRGHTTPPQDKYTHHLALFHDPSRYSSEESFVVGISPICIVYNFSTSEEELSMYLADFVNAMLGNVSSVYFDEHLLQKLSERRDYDLYLPPATSPVGRAFIYSMQKAGYDRLFTSPTSYPSSLFGSSVKVTSDVLATITADTTGMKTYEKLGIASYAEAIAADVSCMKIRIPRVGELDDVVSPRLRTSFLDLYNVDLVTGMVGLSSSKHVAYPLVGTIVLHAPTKPPCNESRTASHSVLRYLLLDDHVPHAFNFAGFLVINTVDGNKVMTSAIQSLCIHDMHTIPAGGSSVVHSIMTAWIRSHVSPSSLSFPSYPAGGSEVGITNTLSKDYVFGASDYVLSSTHYRTMPSVQMIPGVAMAVSIVVNLGYDDVTVRVPRCALVSLLNGSIEVWNHSWLKKANPELLLPHTHVKVIARADTSGTTNVLLSGLLELDRECNGGIASFSAAGGWPFNHKYVLYANGSDGVSSLLHHTKHSISYLSTPDARAGGFQEVELLNEKNNYVSTSTGESIAHRLSSASIDFTHMQVFFTPSSNSYPFVGITYFLFDTNGWADCQRYQEGLEFIRWTLSDQRALSLTSTYNFISLPRSLAADVDDIIVRRASCGGRLIFPQPPGAPEDVNIGMIVGIVVGLIILIGIPIGWKMSENQRRMNALMNNDRVATELAESISSMRLEDVEYLNTIPNPTRIQSAFIKIIKTLKEYRSYLPASLLEANNGDADNDDEDDEKESVASRSIVRTSSAQSLTSPKTVSSKGSNKKESSSTTAMIATKKRITFGMVNVRDWHAMKLNPTNITDFHTRYIQTVRDAVLQSKGTPDVFLGDRFLATWNTSRALGSHRTAALNAYFTAAKELQSMSMTITYGASSGEVICGNMGCEGMKKYSYIGQCSSLAPILERLNRYYGTKCLVDASMEEEAANNFILCLTGIVPLPRLGINDVKLFDVVSPKAHAEDEWMYQIQKSGEEDSKSIHVIHSVAVTYYHKGMYDEAWKHINEIIPSEERCPRTEKFRERVQFAREKHPNQPPTFDIML